MKRRRGVRVQARRLDPAELNVQGEVAYIVGRAQQRVGCVVQCGVLVWLSTESGDAWLLDLEDDTALPLARDGDRLAVRIVETRQRLVIEWTHDFAIDGEVFSVRERTTGQVRSIVGYGAELLERVRPAAG